MSNQLPKTPPQQPKITVLIANYNYQEWVVQSVDSALNQTYPNIDIVLVDSNSTDASVKNINDAYFKGRPHENSKFKDYPLKVTTVKNSNGKDVKLSLIRLPEKLGPSFARNVGINYAIDDSFAFAILDADDAMFPMKIEKLAREMFMLPKLIGVVYADYEVLNIADNISVREHKKCYSQMELLNNCIVHSGSLVSTAALRGIKSKEEFYDNQLLVAEDWDLWIRISRSYMMTHVPESLTLVRVSPKNTTTTVNSTIWNSCWQRIRDKIEGKI